MIIKWITCSIRDAQLFILFDCRITFIKHNKLSLVVLSAMKTIGFIPRNQFDVQLKILFCLVR